MTSDAAITAYLAAADKTFKLTKSAYTGTATSTTAGTTTTINISLEQINDPVNPLKHMKLTVSGQTIEYYFNSTYMTMEMASIVKAKVQLPAGTNIVTGAGLDSLYKTVPLSKQVYPAQAEIKTITATFEKGGWRMTLDLTADGQKKLGSDDSVTKFTYSCYINADGYIGEETVSMDATTAGVTSSNVSVMTLADTTKDVVILFPDLSGFTEVKYADLFAQ